MCQKEKKWRIENDELLHLFYFHTITILKSSFIKKNFPELSKEPLFFKMPVDNWETVFSMMSEKGWLSEAFPHFEGICQIKVHPLWAKQCQVAKLKCSHEEQVEFLFSFIEYQYRLIYLFNEWLNDTDWRQVELAKSAVAFEEENLQFYFELALDDHQSFLGVLGVLNSFYRLSGQEEKRKEVINKVHSQFKAIDKESYDEEVFDEYKQAFLLIGDVYFDNRMFEDALQSYKAALDLFGEPSLESEYWGMYLRCRRSIGNALLEMKQFNQAEANFFYVLDQAELSGYHELLVGVYQSLSSLYAECDKDFERALLWLKKGFQIEGEYNLRNRAILHQAMGNLYLEFDQYENAQKEMATALSHYVLMEDEQAQAQMHNNLGSLFFILKENQAAKFHYKQAIPYYLQRPDDYMKAEVLSNLGATYSNTDEIPEHKEYFMQALSIYRNQENLYKVAQIYQGLGAMEESLGKFKASKQYYLKALEIFREYEDKDFEGELLHNLGQLHFAHGLFEESKKFSIEALSLYQLRNDTSGVAEVYQNLGNVYYEFEEDEIAEDYYIKALEIYQDIKSLYFEAEVRWNLGSLCKEQRRFSDALTHFSISLDIYKSFDADDEIIKVSNQIAEINILMAKK